MTGPQQFDIDEHRRIHPEITEGCADCSWLDPLTVRERTILKSQQVG